MELDHFYFCTTEPDKIAKQLSDFGLREGAANTHPGQGTANRRFFFSNSMLELLYISNREELESARTAVLGLAEQFDSITQNKIGFILRPSENESKQCPFKSVKYHPLYLPQDLSMDVASPSNDQEPKFIYLDFVGRPENRTDVFHEINGQRFQSITNFILKTSAQNLSETAAIVSQQSNLNIEFSNEDILEIELENGINNHSTDFLPDLPLRIKW